MIDELMITDENEDGGEITIRSDTGEMFVIQVFMDEHGRIVLCLDGGSFEQPAINSVILCA